MTSNTKTSIITSNVRQINLSNENMKYKHWCFQISKMVSSKNHFGVLIYILPWKYLFEIYFRLLRRNNKLKTTTFRQTFDVIIDVSVFDIIKGLCLRMQEICGCRCLLAQYETCWIIYSVIWFLRDKPRDIINGKAGKAAFQIC